MLLEDTVASYKSEAMTKSPQIQFSGLTLPRTSLSNCNFVFLFCSAGILDFLCRFLFLQIFKFKSLVERHQIVVCRNWPEWNIVLELFNLCMILFFSHRFRSNFFLSSISDANVCDIFSKALNNSFEAALLSNLGRGVNIVDVENWTKFVKHAFGNCWYELRCCYHYVYAARSDFKKL